MKNEEALRLLKEESGTHFDPQIVKMFLRYLERRQKTDDSKGPGLRSLLLPTREPRYPFKAKVRASITNLVVDGETLDISQGGLFLQVDRSLAGSIKENIPISMNIDLPDVKGVHVSGVVRWVNEHEAKASGQHPCGLGIAFNELDQNVKRLLRHSIHKQVRRRDAILQPQPLFNI